MPRSLPCERRLIGKYRCRMTGLTLSTEQLAFSRARLDDFPGGMLPTRTAVREAALADGFTLGAEEASASPMRGPCANGASGFSQRRGMFRRWASTTASGAWGSTTSLIAKRDSIAGRDVSLIQLKG